MIYAFALLFTIGLGLLPIFISKRSKYRTQVAIASVVNVAFIIPSVAGGWDTIQNLQVLVWFVCIILSLIRKNEKWENSVAVSKSKQSNQKIISEGIRIDNTNSRLNTRSFSLNFPPLKKYLPIIYTSTFIATLSFVIYVFAPKDPEINNSGKIETNFRSGNSRPTSNSDSKSVNKKEGVLFDDTDKKSVIPNSQLRSNDLTIQLIVSSKSNRAFPELEKYGAIEKTTRPNNLTAYALRLDPNISDPDVVLEEARRLGFSDAFVISGSSLKNRVSPKKKSTYWDKTKSLKDEKKEGASQRRNLAAIMDSNTKQKWYTSGNYDLMLVCESPNVDLQFVSTFFLSISRSEALQMYDNTGFYSLCFKGRYFDKCYTRSEINYVYDALD